MLRATIVFHLLKFKSANHTTGSIEIQCSSLALFINDIENPDLYDSGLQDTNLSEILHLDPTLTITKIANKETFELTRIRG